MGPWPLLFRIVFHNYTFAWYFTIIVFAWHFNHIIEWLSRSRIFKLKSFYDHMDFNTGQRLEITKAVIELTKSSKGSGFVLKKPYGGS